MYDKLYMPHETPEPPAFAAPINQGFAAAQAPVYGASNRQSFGVTQAPARSAPQSSAAGSMPPAAPGSARLQPAGNPAALKFLSFRCGFTQGQGKRDYQEDRLLLLNCDDVTLMRSQGCLAAVADGMGGMKGGAEASSCAAADLEQSFQYFDRSRPLGPQLCEAAVAAAGHVCSILGGQGGSTLVCCMFYGCCMDWVSLGDSYIYLFRDGILFRVNQEQTMRSSILKDTIASGSLSTASAENNPEKSCLINFLGARELSEPEYSRRPLELKNGDKILICSDGVPNALTNPELGACLNFRDPQQSAAAISNLIENKNFQYQDNYTAALIYCGD